MGKCLVFAALTLVACAPTVTSSTAPACSEELTDFVDALEEFDSRLSRELSLEAYRDQLADVQALHDEVVIGTEPENCLRMGKSAERALDKYISGENIWDAVGYCPQLTRTWREARHLLKDAALD